MTLIMTNLMSCLMTLITNVFTLEDVDDELKEAATPLRTYLFGKVVSASLVNDELNEDNVNGKNKASNVLNKDVENILIPMRRKILFV